MKNIIKAIALILLVSACSKTQSQNQYSSDEVGQPINIDYAIVLDVRPVQITGRSSPESNAPLTGVGAATGPAGTYVDTELGNVWGAGVGAAEQVASGKKGYEYTIFTESKATKVIVQYQDPKDVVFMPNDLVLLQSTGSFHRLLSSVGIPDKIKKAHLKKIDAEESDASLPPALATPANPAAPANPPPADVKKETDVPKDASPATPKKEGDR